MQSEVDVAPLEQASDPELDYASYLHLDQLLALQDPRSRPCHRDELHFIVTHQSMELWFKVIIDELLQAGARLRRLDWVGALQRLRRASAMSEVQLHQLRTLDHLDPHAFSLFRGFLGTASGAQSTQFRVLELVAGLRDDDYLAQLERFHPVLPGEFLDALAVPSVADSVGSARDALGVDSWIEFYRRQHEFGVQLLVVEALLDFDQTWMQWRYEHLITVERIIGRLTRGTGGTLPRHLQDRVGVRFFPELWDARPELQRVEMSR